MIQIINDINDGMSIVSIHFQFVIRDPNISRKLRTSKRNHETSRFESRQVATFKSSTVTELQLCSNACDGYTDARETFNGSKESDKGLRMRIRP